MCVCGQTIFPQGGADSIQSDLASPALKHLLNGEKRRACRGSERAGPPSFVSEGDLRPTTAARGEPTPLRPVRSTLDLYVEDV